MGGKKEYQYVQMIGRILKESHSERQTDEQMTDCVTETTLEK